MDKKDGDGGAQVVIGSAIVLLALGFTTLFSALLGWIGFGVSLIALGTLLVWLWVLIEHGAV